MKRVYILAATGAVLLQLGLSNIPTTAKASYKALCPSVSTGLVHCHAHVALDGSGHPFATAALSRGLSPSDLHDAYKLPAIPAGNFVWNGQTVAVVDAYDNPNAASDLFSYRKQFGLPVCAGANVNCLFSKLNQNGGSSLPAGSTSWGQEINLDIQMVSAICPQCKIILVEASSPTMANLSKAVDTAAALGVSAISNSYGGNEAASAASMQNHYNHPGIAITASSGDSGYGVEFPASSQYVTSVGGTSLQRSSGSRGWTESAWSGAGSGCSRYINQPSWQPTIGNCKKRLVADVSAVADPNTGLAVYDSFGSHGSNWYVVGGTSAAAPIIAGVYAQAKATNKISFSYGELPYTHPKSLFDISGGKNGICATAIKALCTGSVGYDGPTGLGTPNGLGAF